MIKSLIQTNRALVHTLLLFSMLNMGSVVRATPDSSQHQEPPLLTVTIAVPEQHGSFIVWMTAADPHIDVVIQNVSSQPLDFYAEDCSGGNNNLRLEILAIDNKTLPKPIIVERNFNSWYSNVIRTVTLEPGAMMVREVHFTVDHSLMGHPYGNFPAMGIGESHTFRMRAVFEFMPSKKYVQTTKASTKPLPSPVTSNKTDYQIISPHPWTGSVSSATNDYFIELFSN